MIWYICFIAAAVAAVATIAYSANLLFGRYKKKRRINVIHVLIAGFFVMGFLLIIAPHYELYKGENLAVLKTVVVSFQKVIRLFGAHSIYDVLLEMIPCAPNSIADYYVSFVLAVQFIAPLLTFGFVLSFFNNVVSLIRYLLAYRNDVYIFSCLNERALTLAEDIINNHPNVRVVFTDCPEKPKGNDLLLSERANGINAICFSKNIRAVNWGVHSKNSRIFFFAMCDDDAKNIDHATKLLKSYNMFENANLYIFSSGVIGELLMAGRAKGSIRVRRVNVVKSQVSRILFEKGDEIFRSACESDKSNTKNISAVIVGLGTHGTEMLKALAWFCQMDGYSLKITGFDKDTLAEEKFTSLCPELMSPEYNGVSVCGEAEYSIRIHSGCDVSSKSFTDLISDIDDATYVFVSLGSDELNTATAVKLRMLFERNGTKPVIHSVITNSGTKETVENARNSAGQPYAIDYIGDIKSSYSERVIIDSELEEDAFRRHKSYCGGDTEKEEDFWRYEYCYHSSVASALHAKARIKCGISGADKKEEELSEKEREIIESLEHRRWNAYMRSEGFVYSGSDERSSRNDLAKTHNNLVVYSVLSDEDKRKDSRISTGG